MSKRIFSAIIIALFVGISFSAIAQPKATKVDAPTNTSNTANPKAKSVDDPDNLKGRIDAQMQRYVKDYNLTEQQQKEVAKVLTDFEAQSTDLRTKLNSLNKEKIEKIESILTPEQKQMKEQVHKEKRGQFLDRKGEGKLEPRSTEPRVIPAPKNE